MEVPDENFEARYAETRQRVAALMKELRTGTKDGEREVTYSQGQHTAIQQLLVAAFMQIESLSERLADIESQPSLKYSGVWNAAKSYAAGSVVTFQGSAWHSSLETKGCKPGDGTIWKLIVKKGRDAR